MSVCRQTVSHGRPRGEVPADRVEPLLHALERVHDAELELDARRRELDELVRSAHDDAGAGVRALARLLGKAPSVVHKLLAT